MKIIYIAVMSILLLQGCSKNYIYVKPKPYNFQTTEQPKTRVIRVLKEDLKLYEAYITNFRNMIDFHNLQIQDYKSSFDNNETGEK